MEGVDKPNKGFRLLDLPPELWSRICKLAVVQPKPIRFRIYLPPGQPPITKVCRAIRDESLPTFLANNVFFAGISSRYQGQWMQAWFGGLGTARRKQLRKLYHYSEDWQWDSFFPSTSQPKRLSPRVPTAGEMADADKVLRRIGGRTKYKVRVLVFED